MRARAITSRSTTTTSSDRDPPVSIAQLDRDGPSAPSTLNLHLSLQSFSFSFLQSYASISDVDQPGRAQRQSPIDYQTSKYLYAMFKTSSKEAHEPSQGSSSRRGSTRNGKSDHPPPSIFHPARVAAYAAGATPSALESPDAALVHSVRVKMASRDQEAMRRARWTMIEGSDASSSSLSANVPPSFSTIPRRSNLAKQFAMTSLAQAVTPPIGNPIGGRSVSGPQPSSSATTTIPSAPEMVSDNMTLTLTLGRDTDTSELCYRSGWS